MAQLTHHTERNFAMPKHEFGTVYCFPPTEEDRTVCVISISRNVGSCRQAIMIYEAPAEPQVTGRHRFDMRTENSPVAVFALQDTVPTQFECPREWHDDMAVGFEYLSA